MSNYHYQKRLELFPDHSAYQGEPPTLYIGGIDVAALAAEYGTPLYIFDQATLDANLKAYRQAFQEYYPGETGLTFAGKAFLNLAMAQWVKKSGLWLDCTGAGEIHVAAQAGLPRSQILVHGVSKNEADLDAAIAHAGVVVVDNLAELRRLAAKLAGGVPEGLALWLRLRPGLAVDTHHYRQTGQEDSKFGMSFSEGLEALRLGQQHRLPVTGIHFHQGSHFHDPAPIAPALETVLDWLVEARSDAGWQPRTLCPGGGWGVPYTEADLPHQPVSAYVELAARTLVAGARQRGLALPALHFEPGRSLVARAGVAVYHLNAVKHTAARRWLLLDGGMADNPRPALYEAEYSALPVQNPARTAAGPAWLAGPYCESGDVLIQGLEMPDLAEGERVAIPVSGAYHLSMGSNYNGARRPAALWLVNGKAHLVQRRETLDDLLRRDLPLPE